MGGALKRSTLVGCSVHAEFHSIVAMTASAHDMIIENKL
jgi:hypothetical protein